jgi:hypothetical protein
MLHDNPSSSSYDFSFSKLYLNDDSRYNSYSLDVSILNNAENDSVGTSSNVSAVLFEAS